MWMLTGDKKETAINLGYSAQLLTPGRTLIDLCDNSDPRDVTTLIGINFPKSTLSVSLTKLFISVDFHFYFICTFIHPQESWWLGAGWAATPPW